MLKPEIHDPQGEAIASACHRLALRVMDLGLEHHLDDDSGHVWQRTPAPARLDPGAAGRSGHRGPRGAQVLLVVEALLVAEMPPG